jgi:thiamine biosynthesis protein ThiI
MTVNIVGFTKIQEAIRDTCKEDLFTIIMRRVMLKIACNLAREKNARCIITGESLGQVASQTLGAIQCTDAAADLPVFRPFIGTDKQEIVDIARAIDTFETSILPYEDCCTVFTPKHPKTNPYLEEVLEEEAKLNLDELTKNLVPEYIRITPWN